jgi:hypothetical protein
LTIAEARDERELIGSLSILGAETALVTAVPRVAVPLQVLTLPGCTPPELQEAHAHMAEQRRLLEAHLAPLIEANEEIRTILDRSAVQQGVHEYQQTMHRRTR